MPKNSPVANKKPFEKLPDENWGDYENVNGARIKDLNRQRDRSIDRIKKEWIRSREYHFKNLDNSMNKVSWTEPSLVAMDFQLPILSRHKKAL